MCCSAIRDGDELNYWCKLQGLKTGPHALYMHWSITELSCWHCMYNQCFKMPGLRYEFNDTEHDNKTMPRNFCLVFPPLCWHHEDTNVLYWDGRISFVTFPLNNIDVIAKCESVLKMASSWWQLKWWWLARVGPCGMQFQLSSTVARAIRAAMLHLWIVAGLSPPSQSFDNMQSVSMALWFLSWQVNKL